MRGRFLSGMFPNIGELRAMFDEKFQELLDELRAVRAILEQIRDKP
jgi:hypothetical protein